MQFQSHRDRVRLRCTAVLLTGSMDRAPARVQLESEIIQGALPEKDSISKIPKNDLYTDEGQEKHQRTINNSISDHKSNITQETKTHKKSHFEKKECPTPSIVHEGR